MSVVDYQEKLRTKSCALFLKLRFWIPPCAKPAGREERQRDKAARPRRKPGRGGNVLMKRRSHRKPHAFLKAEVSPDYGGGAQPHPAYTAGPTCPQAQPHPARTAMPPWDKPAHTTVVIPDHQPPESNFYSQPETRPLPLIAHRFRHLHPTSPRYPGARDGGSELPPSHDIPPRAAAPPYPRTGCWGRSFQFHELHVKN